MKKIFLSLIAGAVVAGTAQATPVTYAYTAKIQSVYEGNANRPYLGLKDVASTVIQGHTVETGSLVTGYFTFDTDTPLSTRPMLNQDPGSIQSYESGTLNNQLSANFENGLAFLSEQNQDLIFNSNPLAYVKNNYANQNGQDEFGISGGAVTAEGWHRAYLHLVDPTGTVFNGTDLPKLLDLHSFPWTNFVYDATSNNGDLFQGVNGDIISLQAVPEPASAALMLSGLGLLAAARRRKTSCGK